MFQVVHADEPGRKKKRKRKPVSSAALCQGQSESLLLGETGTTDSGLCAEER